MLAGIAAAYTPILKKPKPPPSTQFPPSKTYPEQAVGNRSIPRVKVPGLLGAASVTQCPWHEKQSWPGGMGDEMIVASAQTQGPVPERDLKHLEPFPRNQCAPFVWLNLPLHQGLGRKAAAGINRWDQQQEEDKHKLHLQKDSDVHVLILLQYINPRAIAIIMLSKENQRM